MRAAMLAVFCVLGASASAAEDAFTPVGAERAGNAEGSIPAWTGGLTAPPNGYDPSRHEIDPYAADAPLFSIDRSNIARHDAQLTDGQRALLAAYPESWHINVFPTHRSAAYPEYVYAALADNAQRATWVSEGKGTVQGARVTSPFPKPRNGEQAMWNHLLRYRAVRVQRVDGSAAVTSRGRFEVVTSLQDIAFPYGTRKPLAHEFDNLLLVAKTKTLLPSPLTGQGTLVHETIDQTRDPRKVWRYLPSIRQLLRQPNFGYSMPSPQTDALRTVDDFELFAGPTDHFDWTLVGKREVFIPYNSYRVHADTLAVEDIVGAKHLAPDLLRYELHRVWVVEARLKPNVRHVYARRMFYLDEDSWQVALSDSWDADGKLIRTAEAHALVYYGVPVLWATLYAFYDLRNGRYLVEGLDNERAPYRFLETADPREFSPNALNYYVR